MKVARYYKGGQVVVEDAPEPELPPGGLLVKTEACGLSTGELITWYMDQKAPHVLGHEVVGKIIGSQDRRFPVGSRVFAHHHVPCMNRKWMRQCIPCIRHDYVHCPQWKATNLIPGGMAEIYAVPKENLEDSMIVDDLTPEDAALIEPLACVVKSVWQDLITVTVHSNKKRTLTLGRPRSSPQKDFRGRTVVIGLDFFGLLHMFMVGVAYGLETNPKRLHYAKKLGFHVGESNPKLRATRVFVLPGTQEALDLAAQIIEPGGDIVLFSPFPPNELATLNLNEFYFKDIRIRGSYSCSFAETDVALRMLRNGELRAKKVVSDFISLEELPRAYQAMKEGEILKAMVMF